jgi:hypothetical protein
MGSVGLDNDDLQPVMNNEKTNDSIIILLMV